MMEKTNRGPKKIQGHYGMKDYYKYYKNNNESPVSSVKYNKVISLFNKELVEFGIRHKRSFFFKY